MLIRKQLWLAGGTLLLGAVLCIFLLTRYLAEPRLYQQAQDSAQLRVEGIAAEIHGVLQATASLTRSMAALSATLPLDESTFTAHLRDLVDEFGNDAIAGGGIWPEPRRLDPARAGEQGRGFAVVADEVRTLAGRTQASASNIEGRTATIATAVEEQTRVAQEIHQLAERIRSLSEQNAQDASHLNDMSRNYTAVAQRLHAISRN